MQTIVQSYLKAHFELDTSQLENDGIYLIEDKREYRVPFYGSYLINELVIVFAIDDEDVLKSYVNAWAVSLKSNIDLEFYWTEEEAFLFPKAIRVDARLLATDLVSVQPMGAPSGKIRSFDIPKYGELVEANKNGRVYPKEIWGLLDAQRHFITGELNHPIGISSRKKQNEI